MVVESIRMLRESESIMNPFYEVISYSFGIIIADFFDGENDIQVGLCGEEPRQDTGEHDAILIEMFADNPAAKKEMIDYVAQKAVQDYSPCYVFDDKMVI